MTRTTNIGVKYWASILSDRAGSDLLQVGDFMHRVTIGPTVRREPRRGAPSIQVLRLDYGERLSLNPPRRVGETPPRRPETTPE
jgi:hypothetical protein